jgi:hypothetical protein
MISLLGALLLAIMVWIAFRCPNEVVGGDE